MTTLYSWSAALIIPLILSLGVQASAPRPILSEDFERNRRNSLGTHLADNQYLTVVNGEGVDGSKALKARYVGSDRGSERIVTRYPLRRELREATLSFDVRFAEDFQFVGGGKLHGLGPDRPVSGGNPRRPDGWSTRMMFRRDGGLGTYIYDQDTSKRFGISMSTRGFTFEKERYYAISYHVVLNDRRDESTGIVKIYIDGELMVTHDKLHIRGQTRRDTLITHFLFSTFHGGSSPDWAPKDDAGNYVTVHAYFDNFAIYEGEYIRKVPGPCWQ